MEPGIGAFVVGTPVTGGQVWDGRILRGMVSGSNVRAMTTFERRMLQEQDSISPTQDELVEVLRAVREAIDIPHGATVGDQEKRDALLIERIGHVKVMLGSLLSEDSWRDWSWSTAYLRERLAEHPAQGYKTWDERVVELEAARKASPVDGAS
jgi:hypothetical protein